MMGQNVIHILYLHPVMVTYLNILTMTNRLSKHKNSTSANANLTNPISLLEPYKV